MDLRMYEMDVTIHRSHAVQKGRSKTNSVSMLALLNDETRHYMSWPGVVELGAVV